MGRVDEAGMCRRSRVDPLVGVLRFDVEGNRDDRDAERLEFCVERLPPGQAVAAASITGPGDQ